MSKAKCAGKNNRGAPCGNYPVRGAKVCKKHGAGAPQVAAKAAVRYELMQWGLDAPTVEPGETLLKLVSQAAARAERYAAEVEALVAESPSLREALVREAYGEFGPAGEYVRGLVVLESQERDRLAGWCVKAIAAGLAERQVRLAERTGAMIADVLRAVLGDPALGLTPEQRAAAPDTIRRHLALVAAA